MAENKKSFLFYADYLETFEELSDSEAGQLIKHILRYVNDRNPDTDNRVVKIVFGPIKQQLKRDLKAWETERTRKSEGGKNAMKKRWGDNSDKIVKESYKSVTEVITPITVNVNDNVTVKEERTLSDDLWTSHKTDFIDSFRWKEKFCIDKKVTIKNLELKMQLFIQDIELKEDYKTAKDLRHHFLNWFNKNRASPVPINQESKPRDDREVYDQLYKTKAS